MSELVLFSVLHGKMVSIPYANSEGLDQSALLPNLIGTVTVHLIE